MVTYLAVRLCIFVAAFIVGSLYAIVFAYVGSVL